MATTRIRKSKVQPVIAESAPIEELSFEEIFAQATEGTYLDQNITKKRKWAAFIASAISAFGLGYIGGVLTGYMVLGIATFTGSLFMMFISTILGILLTMYASMQVSASIANYILSKEIDKDITKVSATIKGWFSFGKDKVAA